MRLQTKEITELRAVDGNITITLDGNIAPFPIFVYWDGVRYDLNNILGDVATINSNIITLPLKMEGDKCNIDYWVYDTVDIQRGITSFQQNTKSSCESIRFIFNNCIPYSNLSITQEPPAELGVDNIKDEWRSRILRVLDSSIPTIIKGRLDKSRTLSGFALSNFNLTSSANVKLRIYNKPDTPTLKILPQGSFIWGVNPWGVAIEDLNEGLVYSNDSIKVVQPIPQGEFIWGVDSWGENNLIGVNPTFALYFEQVYGNYFEIELIDSSIDYIDLCQVFLGDAVILDNNFSYGFSFKWSNNQSFERTEGGSLITIGNKQVWREVSIPFEMMTDADMQKITKQQRLNAGEAIFVSVFPNQENTEFEMPAKIIPPTFRLQSLGVWANTLDLKEV